MCTLSGAKSVGRCRHRQLLLLITGLALMLVVTASPQPAQAAGSFTGWLGSGAVIAQCQRQGTTGASFGWYWNPYSWYCYTLSIPAGISWNGSVDLNAACREEFPTWQGYPATQAKVIGDWNVYGWACVDY